MLKIKNLLTEDQYSVNIVTKATDITPITELTCLLTRMEIPLLALDVGKNGDRYCIKIVADTNGKATPEQLNSEIRHVLGDNIVELSPVTQEDRLKELFKEHEDSDVLAQLNRQVQAAMITGLYEIFSTGSLTILWMIGKLAGTRVAVMSECLNLQPQQRMIACLTSFKYIGWGSFEVLEPQGDRCIVRVRENFECAETINLKGYQSSLMRGMILGVVSKVYARPFTCKEERCRKSGESFCEFVCSCEK